MKSPNPLILAINGGSSSIKLALFETGDSLRRILEGGIERIGLPHTRLWAKDSNQADNFSRLGGSAGLHGGGEHSNGLDRRTLPT
jgi:acetate kinase